LDGGSDRRKAATYTGQHKHIIKAHRLQCLEWDSNTRPQRAKTFYALARTATVIGVYTGLYSLIRNVYICNFNVSSYSWNHVVLTLFILQEIAVNALSDCKALFYSCRYRLSDAAVITGGKLN
jgi:hypothetical protein